MITSRSLILRVLFFSFLAASAFSARGWNITLSATNQLEPVVFGLSPDASDDYDPGSDIFSQTPVQSKTIMVLDDLYSVEINKNRATWVLAVGVPSAQGAQLIWNSLGMPSDIDLFIGGQDMRGTDHLYMPYGNNNYTIIASQKQVTTSTAYLTTTTVLVLTTTSTTIDNNVLGDANGDGHVNYSDLLILASSYGKRPGDAKYDVGADFNKDGIVDYSDLLILASHYHKSH